MSKITTKYNKKILFLGYSQKETILVKELKKRFKVVKRLNKKINLKETKGYNLIICFGYRFKINNEIIKKFKKSIFNLHISYLPFNRGAHPNFWSHFDGTPHGVTIHSVSEKIDQGDIIFQKKIVFNKNERTFKSTYFRLFSEIEMLLIDKIDILSKGNYPKYKQRGLSTFHSHSDLPKEFSGWNSNIKTELLKLDKIYKEKKMVKMKLIDEIESVRTRNNVNWMDLLRLSYKLSPNQSKKLINKINKNDNKISDLFSKLGN